MHKIFSAIIAICIVGCQSDKKSDISTPAVNTEHLTVALASKAHCLYEQSKFTEAIKLYDSLISIDSTKGGYYFKRGFCKSQVLTLDSLNTTLHGNGVSEYATYKKLKRQNQYAAIADYLTAIKRNYSQKSSAFLNLGIIYALELKKYDSAVYFYNQCLKLDPTDLMALKMKQDATEKLSDVNDGVY